VYNVGVGDLSRAPDSALLARPQARNAAAAAGVALALGELVEMQQHNDVIRYERRLDAAVTNMTSSVRQG
jgi:hypothetical protein